MSRVFVIQIVYMETLSNASAPYIPRPEGRGFTAFFDKGKHGRDVAPLGPYEINSGENPSEN